MVGKQGDLNVRNIVARLDIQNVTLADEIKLYFILVLMLVMEVGTPFNRKAFG